MLISNNKHLLSLVVPINWALNMYTFFPHQQLTITINYLGTINNVSQTNEYKKSHFKYVRDVWRHYL